MDSVFKLPQPVSGGIDSTFFMAGVIVLGVAGIGAAAGLLSSFPANFMLGILFPGHSNLATTLVSLSCIAASVIGFNLTKNNQFSKSNTYVLEGCAIFGGFGFGIGLLFVPSVKLAIRITAAVMTLLLSWAKN